MKAKQIFRMMLILLRHEWYREWRQGQWLAGSLLYLAGGIFVAQLMLRPAGPLAWVVLYWLMMLFTAIYVLARSYLGLSHGLLMYYRVATPGLLLWLIKVITGTVSMWILMALGALLMGVWMGYPIQSSSIFLVTQLLAGPLLATVLTLVSAMARGASNPAQLMPVLGFPLLVPCLLLVHRLTRMAMDGLEWPVVWPFALAMVALLVMMLALGGLLFPFLWKD
jgi:heme exporter protein B